MTIDLRGIGPRLHAHAAARGKTTASVVRAAVVAMLDAEGVVEESFFVIRDNGPTAEDIANDKKQQATYRRDLIANREKIKALLVELIRYQDWPPPHSEARS